MLKILVADDEVFVRMGLKMALQSEANDFCLVGEASNGRQALEIIEKVIPDIVITDIKMPEMDGVELIKEITKKYPEIKCLVLSNFNDFEYVKEAMKNGAIDYFLKATIETEKIIQVLHTIGENIKLNRIIDDSKNERYYADKNKFIAYVIKDSTSQENIREFVKSNRLKLFSEQGFIINLTLEDYNNVLKVKFNGDNELLYNTLKNIIEGVINSQYVGEVFEDKPGSFIIIITYDSKTAESDENWLAERIYSVVKNYLEVEVKIIYDIEFHSFLELKKLMIQLKDIKEAGFYSTNLLLSYKKKIFFNEKADDLYKIKKSLPLYIKYFDSSKFKESIEMILSIAESEKIKPSTLISILISTVNMLEEELNHIGEYDPRGCSININGLEIVNQIICSNSFNDVKRFFLQYIFSFSAYMEKVQKSSIRIEVMKAIEHIEKNYSAKITLEQVAKLVSINRSYFCRLFKNETGLTFQDYLIKLRMEKAKELLLNSDMKITEIAEKVGYLNIFHFDRYFKNYFNITPGEYRKTR